MANTGLLMKYFVLKPRGGTVHAIASRTAMHAYAKVIKAANPEFAKELIEWASQEGAVAYEMTKERASQDGAEMEGANRESSG